MARQVEMEPSVAETTPLPGTEVRDGDEREAARVQRFSNPFEIPCGVRRVLQRMHEDCGVVVPRLERNVGQRARSHVDTSRGRRGACISGRLDANGVPAALDE